jgi:hypothetical protein
VVHHLGAHLGIDRAPVCGRHRDDGDERGHGTPLALQSSPDILKGGGLRDRRCRCRMRSGGEIWAGSICTRVDNG